MKSIILRQTEARELYAESGVEITRDVKPQPEIEIRQDHPEITEVIWQDANGLTNAGGGGDVLKYLAEQKCPYRPGAVLKVREALDLWPGTVATYTLDGEPVVIDFDADYIDRQVQLDSCERASLSAAQMPLWASRASVRVVSVDVVHNEKWQWKIRLEKVTYD